MISFSCKNCKHEYQISDKHAGKKAKCKKCNSIILIPSVPPISISSPTICESQVDIISKSLSKPLVNNVDSATNTEQMDNHSAPCVDIPEHYKEIISEIEKLENSNRSWQKNLLILFVTLFIFFQIGLFKIGMTHVIALIFVLLVHEMGHFLGMRIFGYRNVQMFFIPFLGAAVSGQSHNVASYKKAIVTLMGPVPGLFLGLIILFVYAKTQSNFLLLLSTFFIAINLFNMLPFFPLDGGRFVHEILFSRNRYVELVFKIIASLTLIILGVVMHFWFLAIIGFFSIVAIPITFKVAGISKNLRESGLAGSCPEEGESQTSRNHMYMEIIDRIKEGSLGKHKPKMVAGFTRDVTERLHCHPPRVFPTVGLLGVYLFSCFMPFVFLFTTARSGFFITKNIVENQNAEGHTICSEQAYLFGKFYSQIELSDDGSLYHGKSVKYNISNGNIVKEGNWLNGRKHGEYRNYDQQGNLISVIVYDNNKFVSRKQLKDGKWIEQSWEDLPPKLQQRYDINNKKPPKGPKSKR